MDLSLFQFIRNFAAALPLSDFLTLLFANYALYVLIVAAVVFTALEKSMKRKLFVGIFLFLSVIISRGILTELIRFFYARARPFEALTFSPLFVETSYAFPSGHAAFLFALSFGVFSFNRKWGWWFLGFSLLNGIARVAAGVHWPSDIAGGILVGIISFFFVRALLKRFEPELVSGAISPQTQDNMAEKESAETHQNGSLA